MLFRELKELFIVKPILKIYILNSLTVIKTDILNYVLNAYIEITRDTYLNKPKS